MEVRVELIYPKLEFVSDRTFRDSLKLASRTIHAIHLSEIQFVLSISDLNPRVKQSVWDQMRSEVDHLPNYYIESVRRGSLTIALTLSASAYFLLQKTIGKTLEVAWERTGLHRRLAGFLSNSVTGTDVTKPGTSTKSQGKEGARWKWLEREFAARFLNQPGFGRFQVVDFGTEEDANGDMHIRITFDLADEYAELEGTFSQLLYGDFIERFGPSKKKTAKKSGKSVIRR
jgi:hypothetical protein